MRRIEVGLMEATFYSLTIPKKVVTQALLVIESDYKLYIVK